MPDARGGCLRQRIAAERCRLGLSQQDVASSIYESNPPSRDGGLLSVLDQHDLNIVSNPQL